MKITSKLATAVAILGIGLGGAASVSQTQNQPKEVQAAAKPKKSKVHHYKKAHVVMGWGWGPESGAIDGYKYINGHKWYHIKEYGGSWINSIDLKKPLVYTAKSNVIIYEVGSNSDGTVEVSYKPKTIVKKGTTIGKFSYLKPVSVTTYEDPDTGDAIKFTGKKTVQEHSSWIPDVNDLSKGEVEGTYTVESGKYLEILLPNGSHGFIKARDISKFKKGGSSKAFKKLQDVSPAMYGFNAVKGGIKDAQWF